MKNYDPLDIQSQDRIKEESRVRDRLSKENEEADIKWLMSNKWGRRILWRMLDRAGVFRLSFNTNAMQMAFAEGNRNEGLRTLTLIHSQSPELYPQMIKENTHDNRNTDDGNNHNNQ